MTEEDKPAYSTLEDFESEWEYDVYLTVLLISRIVEEHGGQINEGVAFDVLCSYVFGDTHDAEAMLEAAEEIVNAPPTGGDLH